MGTVRLTFERNLRECTYTARHQVRQYISGAVLRYLWLLRETPLPLRALCGANGAVRCLWPRTRAPHSRLFSLAAHVSVECVTCHSVNLRREAPRSRSRADGPAVLRSAGLHGIFLVTRDSATLVACRPPAIWLLDLLCSVKGWLYPFTARAFAEAGAVGLREPVRPGRFITPRLLRVAPR